MSKFIEAFYYGNIEPQKINTELNAKLKKESDSLSKTEEQLTVKLTEEEKALFMKLASQSNNFLCASNVESFIAGFRLGAKFTYDTFVTE